jgi:2-C-methyl-D-erythritol 4-phosphate cytidylyltransferase
MGSAIAKQYLDLKGVPILARTLLAFQQHPLVHEIVVTVPAGHEEFCKLTAVDPFRIEKVSAIVAGGTTRQESVRNGLQRLTHTEIVAIHDGVRPLVSADVITGTIEAARASGAAVACVPIRETLKKQVGTLLETVSRAGLWIAHTPQTFRTPLIVQAHRRALEDNFEGSDDAVLVERLGYPVTIIQDAEDNLKITTPEDLTRAGLLLGADLHGSARGADQ